MSDRGTKTVRVGEQSRGPLQRSIRAAGTHRPPPIRKEAATRSPPALLCFRWKWRSRAPDGEERACG
ncbi:hypothetical protein NL676_015920 [Syzygium grande]|nr:hypothetical protein NL676_015920 [Syzygium grande]